MKTTARRKEGFRAVGLLCRDRSSRFVLFDNGDVMEIFAPRKHKLPDLCVGFAVEGMVIRGLPAERQRVIKEEVTSYLIDGGIGVAAHYRPRK